MLNFSINNLTLMALTLAIGFFLSMTRLCFLENVVRRAEHGESILKSDFQQRWRNFLYHPLDDPFACCGFHTAGFHPPDYLAASSASFL